ncbi:MAG: helix-turn-helix domain-containing protein [Opitutaceae bacterium]|nr:helix-turn-helix domain-containing protein [Opitutaceae bacterium]
MLRTENGRRMVIVSGIVLAHYAVGDRIAEAHARVALVEQGWADQNDVARVFGCCARTVRREQRRFDDGGMAALGQADGYPKGRPRVTLTFSVERLKREGHSNREIARRLGITERAVRKRLRRASWVEPTTPEQKRLPLAEPMAPSPAPVVAAAEQGCGPNLSAFCAEHEEGISFDHDPSDRRVDRLMAYLGLLEDAAPLFRSERAVPRAGVLLAIAPRSSCPHDQHQDISGAPLTTSRSARRPPDSFFCRRSTPRFARHFRDYLRLQRDQNRTRNQGLA